MPAHLGAESLKNPHDIVTLSFRKGVKVQANRRGKFPTSTVFFYPNQCFFLVLGGRVFENGRRTSGVWHGTDFASSLQHFIFLRRAKFHGFKRTLTFSHAKATTKGPLEMSIRFGLFVHFLDETGLNCIEDMPGA